MPKLRTNCPKPPRISIPPANGLRRRYFYIYHPARSKQKFIAKEEK